MKKLNLSALVLSLILCACGGNGETNIKETTISNDPKNLEEANFLRIAESVNGYKTLTVTNTWNGKEKYDTYTLVPRDSTNLLSKDLYTLPYPAKRVICMSSSHVAYLRELDEENIIKGISGTRFITNEKVQKLIAGGEIEDVGSQDLPNYEKIISLKPDFVIAYGINGDSNTYIEKLQRFGVKVLTIADYLETDPLGKAEYIKLFGELTGKRMAADSIYSHICSEYKATKNSIAQKTNVSNKKRVLVNLPYKGIWYIPGKGSYLNYLINDAGGIVLGAEETNHNTQLNFEAVYQLALQADVWLHTNLVNTTQALENENHLFKNLPVVREHRVYNNTLINTPDGGSGYWETGVVEPHIILKDIAKILYPEFMENSSELKYYRRLE